MKEIIEACKVQRTVCTALFRYNQNARHLIPLKTGDALFLSAEDRDFLLDGYTIRRYKDLKKVKAKNDLCDRILKLEGITDGIEVPGVNIGSWKTVFEDLKSIGKNIIVEKESLDEDEWELVIGRIEKIFSRFAYVRHFDADGVWQDEPYRIPYSQITSVTFSSRYVDVFSKYV
jgi:hypothetical protein